MGMHRFYAQKNFTALCMWVLTPMFFGIIWWFIDLFMIVTNRFNYDKYLLIDQELTTNVSDNERARLMNACIVVGIFGIHRLYSEKYITGLIQFLTLGGFLVWWLCDIVCIYKNQFPVPKTFVLRYANPIYRD
jgi:TM2 domain-containing membrane protein YozV